MAIKVDDSHENGRDRRRMVADRYSQPRPYEHVDESEINIGIVSEELAAQMQQIFV